MGARGSWSRCSYLGARSVSETLVACPGLRSRKGFTESTVAAATPPQVRGVDATSTGNGAVRTLTRDPLNDKTLIQLKTPGDRGSYTGRNGERDSVTGSAEGSLAPGFSVTQTERTVDGLDVGLQERSAFPRVTTSGSWGGFRRGTARGARAHQSRGRRQQRSTSISSADAGRSMRQALEGFKCRLVAAWRCGSTRWCLVNLSWRSTCKCVSAGCRRP